MLLKTVSITASQGIRILWTKTPDQGIFITIRYKFQKKTAMNGTLQFRGKILSGEGKATFFTQLDWVRQQCLDKLGFSPFPGTLNLEVLEEDVPVLLLIKQREGIRLTPPDAAFCEGEALKASIKDVYGCIFIPPHEVNVHSPIIVEFMAPVMVKATLGVGDGDIVAVSVKI